MPSSRSNKKMTAGTETIGRQSIGPKPPIMGHPRLVSPPSESTIEMLRMDISIIETAKKDEECRGTPLN